MPRNERLGSGAAFCAIDLGAQSGRVILVRLLRETLSMREVHRFANEPVHYGSSLHWDAPRLWWEICHGLENLAQDQIDGIGVDAWGVDYALLDARGELLQDPYHYRDPRTRGAMELVFKQISKEEIYRETGIQLMPINTLFQIAAARRDDPAIFEAAEHFLTIPDLFHYWLSGSAVCEFTNATTTQLVNASTRMWATNIVERLGIPSALFGPIAQPGTILGPAKSDIAALRGAPVILPGSHDTASAVAAISARDGVAFLSSGTWSLVGTEIDHPVITPEALRLNFTNEGGVNGTTRLLKNVMGLWILQCCLESWSSRGEGQSHAELLDLGGGQAGFQFLIDPDDESFLNPPDMPEAIDAFCRRTGQARPASTAACIRGILESLAFKYRLVLEDLERLIGRRIEQIRVVGGGSKNRLLNQFTADATNKRVMAGPAEATALGNAAMQMLGTGAVSSLKEARAVIEKSFPVEIYDPTEPNRWDEHAERFRQYCEPNACLK
ncbi:MAG TPA: rhamnulokinase family protein [Candidatus Limnocylindrales bacterium]|nr:rhamnulokinase family protein [Candidatus Limnocylindrales bacterium]